MAMTINTNVISINAQRNLGLSGQTLGTTMQRLSSGLRVNSAKDDAAGLAIAERMNAQAKGLKVAARNANDGISLAQTAEGALGKVGDMLQRMRELAVQSSNATNSADDRKALQAEVSQLRAEIDRVAKTTSFNGKKILDGSFAGGVFQVGAGAGDNITVGGITNAKVNALSKVEYGSNVTATVKASSISNLDEIKAGTLSIRVGAGGAIDLGAIGEASSGQERLGQVVAAINAKTADTGVNAFLVAGEVEGDYTVELRSESDKGVSLTGFTAATTGVGRGLNVGFDAGDFPDYTAVVDEIDRLLSLNALGTTSGSSIEVGDVVALHTAAAALTNLFTDADADAALTAAVDALEASVITQGLEIERDDTVGSEADSVDAVDMDSLEFWRTATNQGIGGGAANTLLAADVKVIKTALTDLKTALAATHLLQQTENLQAAGGVYEEFDALMTATTATDFDATDLNTALAAAGLGSVTLDTLTSSSSPQEWADAKDKLVADFNYLVESKFGIQSSQVDDHVGLVDLDISTQSGSWAAIKHIDAAIDQVNSARADLGALQTRFEKSIENIDIMNENISAARGRIVDADFASETASLSRSQILQQAGTAMVAQANQLPQQVLSLLQ